MKKLYSIRTIILAASLLLQLSPLCFYSHGAAGEVDMSFDPGLNASNPVSVVVVQPDAKVLIGGPLTFINGTNSYGSARLNADGSLDSTLTSGSFQLDLTTNESPVVTFAQPDGKVLVGGYTTFIDYDENSSIVYHWYFLVRFNGDGNRDPSFAPATGPGTYSPSIEAVNALAVQPDGKILVGGNFSSMKGVNRYGLARLNSNGSLDVSFTAPTGFGDEVTALALQPDGKALIGRSFNTGIGLFRVNTNGGYDGSFSAATIAGDYASIYSVAAQSDGKVLVGGYFTLVNGKNRNNLARLNPNGSLDSSFNPGANSSVRSIALQQDAKVLIGGNFTAVAGEPRRYVARLREDSAAPSLSIARSNALMIVSWPVTGQSFQLQETTNLSLPNSWSSVGQPAVTNAGQISASLPATVGSRFFRLKSQ